MSNDPHWNIAIITELRKHNPAVPDAVWMRLEGLLTGRLSERQLPAGELTTIATALITDMHAVAPKVEETK